MTGSQNSKDRIGAMLVRLEEELRLCDELGFVPEAIDLNEAIEKLRARLHMAEG